MNKKRVLYVIIILLIIFIPLTIYSYTLKNNDNIKEENPHHFPYLKGALWFYDKENNLINKYVCEEKNCLYKEGIINNKYVFIRDGIEIKLYDIYENKIVRIFSDLINEDDLFILNENNLWGVLKFDKEINEIVPFKYNNIEFNNNYLFANKLNIDIYDKFGNVYLKDMSIDDYILSNNYIGIISNNKLYIYKNLNDSYLKSFDLEDANKEIIFEENNNFLYIKIDGILIDTIDIF